MKKLFFAALISILSFNLSFAQNTTAKFSSQLWKNAHLGWDSYKGDGYKWSDFYVGTGLARNFKAVPKAYWYVMGDLNWSKYTLYKNERYNVTGNDYYIKTFSFSIPAYVGYNAYQSKAFGIKLYTGPVLETIFSATRDGYAYNDYNAMQFGWTVGTGVKFLYLFGFNVAYRYYPTPVLSNGTLVRSSINFSLGF